MLQLRIRGPAGSSTIAISPQTTRAQLYALISSQTNLPQSTLQVRIGFPKPQIIPDSDLTASVESLGIRNGETLQVSSAIPNPPTPSSNSPPSAPPHLPSSSTSQSKATTTNTTNTPVSKSNNQLSHSIRRAPIKSSLSALTRAQDQSNSSPSANRSNDPSNPASISSASVALEVGHLILRLVPDDNSCLFRAVGILLDRDQSHRSSSAHHDLATRLRQIVADTVRNDPITWCEPILGRHPDLYISKILDKDVWGGAIELAILAGHFKTEICSIDVQTGRVDRFGQNENYPNRIFLVYSGIHYDAISLSPIAPEELSNQSMDEQGFPPDLDFDTTIFPSDQEEILNGSIQLVSQLRQLHYFTDTASFSLRCQTCSAALVGEKDARSHAEATGHTQFGEYNP